MYTRRDVLKIGVASAFLPLAQAQPSAEITKPRFPVGFKPFDDEVGGIARGEMLCVCAEPMDSRSKLLGPLWHFLWDMFLKDDTGASVYVWASNDHRQPTLPQIIKTHVESSDAPVLFVSHACPKSARWSNKAVAAVTWDEIAEAKELVAKHNIALVFTRYTRHAYHQLFADHAFWLTTRSAYHDCDELIVSEFSTNLIV